MSSVTRSIHMLEADAQIIPAGNQRQSRRAPQRREADRLDPRQHRQRASQDQRPEGDELKRRLPLGESRSEEHTSELQSLMRISYAVCCLKKKTTTTRHNQHQTMIT